MPLWSPGNTQDGDCDLDNFTQVQYGPCCEVDQASRQFPSPGKYHLTGRCSTHTAVMCEYLNESTG